MVVFGQSGCIRANWLFSGKSGLLVQRDCIRAKLFSSGKSGCIRAKMLY